MKIGFVIFIVIVIDSDWGMNGDVVYFLSNNIFGVFWIDLKIGEIFIVQEFDYLVKVVYNFFCYVMDRGVFLRKVLVVVKVLIMDENNYVLEFMKIFYFKDIQWFDVKLEVLLVIVSVIDKDFLLII